MNNIFSMPEELRQFCLVDYLAEVRAATSHIELSLAEKVKIEGNTIGTALKLVYAFLWQEEVLFDSTILLDPFVNAVSFADRQYLNLVSALSSIIFP
jgi:hypothetical protein